MSCEPNAEALNAHFPPADLRSCGEDKINFVICEELPRLAQIINGIAAALAVSFAARRENCLIRAELAACINAVSALREVQTNLHSGMNRYVKYPMDPLPTF